MTNKEWSFILSGVGLIAMCVAFYKTKNYALTIGIFYFFLMEFLQGFQYFVIDQCGTRMNVLLTFLGILHVCYQPLFSNLLIFATLPFEKSKKNYDNCVFMFKLSFIGGTFLLTRGLLGVFFPSTIKDDVSGMGHECYLDGYPTGCEGAGPVSSEWLRGNEICTYSGVYHLAWSFPSASTSYYLPSAFIHFFTMFIPYFAIFSLRLWIYGFLLILSGPILAGLITPNLQEQASIWCFFSIIQIVIMVLDSLFFDLTGDFLRGSKRKSFLKKKEDKKNAKIIRTEKKAGKDKSNCYSSESKEMKMLDTAMEEMQMLDTALEKGGGKPAVETALEKKVGKPVEKGKDDVSNLI